MQILEVTASSLFGGFVGGIGPSPFTETPDDKSYEPSGEESFEEDNMAERQTTVD